MLLGDQPNLPGHELKLESRRGWMIPNLRPSTDLAPVQKEDVRRWFSNLVPHARFLSDSGYYDCMGLVFAGRRTQIDIDRLRTILEYDGYHRRPSADSVSVGDVVVYTYQGRPTHVGVVMEKTPGYRIAVEQIMVLSKWGSDGGEYLHEIREVPEHFGVPAEFYTDR